MNEIKYVGIDNWNRPVFKSQDGKKFYGSVHKLFSYEADENEVLSNITEDDLCYFGSFFGCEPMGTPAGDVVIVRSTPELVYTQSRRTTATEIKSCDYYDTTTTSPQAWAKIQNAQGLWTNPELGNWPLNIYANGHKQDRYIIKQFSEQEVSTWIYTEEQREEYAHHLDQLKAYWRAQS